MAGWVEKRGKNKWRLNVPGGTDQDGRRVVFRRNIEASSEREARKMLDVFSAEVQKGLYVEPSKLTFAEFAARWLKDYAQSSLAPKTVFRYRQLLETRILPAMGHLRMEQIKPLHLLEFYAGLQKDGVRTDGRPGGLSERTILHHHRLISAMLQDAVEWQVLPFNPASRVKPPKVPRKEVACYDEKQVAALLQALEGEESKYRVMVVVALFTGIRLGEVVALEWKHVNLEDGTLEVRQAAQYLPGLGNFVKPPKTKGSVRKISLPPFLTATLRQYRREQLEARLKVGDRWQDSDRLFTTWDGRPMLPNTVSNWFGKFLKRHNLPHLPFHGLRHTAATMLINQGLPAKSISGRLGHTNISITMDLYGHYLKDADREAAARLEQAYQRIRDGGKRERA